MTEQEQIEALTKERDNAVYACGLVVQRCDGLVIERDELIVALKFVESVYRQNCVAVGEPSSTLDYLQSVIAKAGVQ